MRKKSAAVYRDTKISVHVCSGDTASDITRMYRSLRTDVPPVLARLRSPCLDYEETSYFTISLIVRAKLNFFTLNLERKLGLLDLMPPHHFLLSWVTKRFYAVKIEAHTCTWALAHAKNTFMYLHSCVLQISELTQTSVPVWRLSKNRRIQKSRKESQTRYGLDSTVLTLGGKRKCALPNTACNWSRGNQCAQLARCVSCSSKTEHTPSTLKFPTPLLHNTIHSQILFLFSTLHSFLPFLSLYLESTYHYGV